VEPPKISSCEMNMPCTLPLCLIAHMWNGNGKGSFFVVAFNFLIHTNFEFPIFLGITTIGVSYVTTSIGCMKLDVNNLLMSCFTAIT
jgi:hypothetical protein